LLLKKGAPVDCPVTEDASTPLHKACAGTKPGHLASVNLLLAANADVHALNKWRETPLLTAANHGNAGAVEALLANDADPCKCTDTGWSPLSIAAYKGHDTVVRLLLEDGAPTEEDDPTLSALLQAATKGLPDTVELLLRHGADHTVTTKKGDTALSILVEQNLIDAAVEMVTEYNASIPRCSRDRKKVQRARLLINLRMKQLEREGKDDNDSTDDDEDTDEETATKDANNALHVENGSLDGSAVTKEKKGKKEKPKELLEAKARLAEEALLEELEKEDALAKVEEAKASNKNAKKKKKKERERLQKMKEDEERRRKLEEEMKERERIRLEKEELRRKQRDEQKKLEEERAIKEMMEREKAMAAKRREREEREKLERDQKLHVQRGSGSVSPTESRSSTATVKPNLRMSATDPTANRKIVSPKGSKKPVIPLPGNRRWENKNTMSQSSAEAAPFIPTSTATIAEGSMKALSTTSIATGVKALQPRESRSMYSDASSVVSNGKSSPSVSPPTQSVGPLNGVKFPVLPLQFTGTSIDHPAVSLYRRDKVTELMQQAASTFVLVGDMIVKSVIYRWIVRASHGKDPFIDPIIPSWIDFDQLVAFFQRQFISENRRRNSNNVAGLSMESLKEAGASFARLCHDFAKQVYGFRNRIEEQLPPNWTDVVLGMTATDSSTSGSVVNLFWANNAQVTLPSATFAALRDRYAGVQSRFLTAVFATRVLYETFQVVSTDTSMEVRLPPSTLDMLSAEIDISAELWSDPFSTNSRNVFWGHFEHVDVLFGGQKPFSKDDHGSEEILAQRGGSVCALLPMDVMMAAKYVQRMVDILDLASLSSVPLSFALFVSSDCFIDPPLNLNAVDLRSFDPRLGDQKSFYNTRVEVLPANSHGLTFGQDEGCQKIVTTTSYFVMLQNEAGRYRFNLSNASTSRILSTLMLPTPERTDAAVLPANTNDFSAPLFQQLNYFDGIDPVTPDSQRAIRSDFGSIGGSTILQSFSPINNGIPRAGRRGRLFDLVDDGDEEQLPDDIMSGMLNNLDVGLFQNTNIGADNVDIEAISLMGIGGPARTLGHPSSNLSGHRLG
jgi:ankyrin repeat protein